MVDKFDSIFDVIEITSNNAKEIASEVKSKLEKMIKKSGTDKSPRILISLSNKTVDNGTKKIIELVESDYDGIVEQVKNYIAKEYDVSFTATEINAIALQKSNILDQITINSSKLKSDIKRYMLQNLGGELSMPQVVTTLQNMYPAYESNIYTLVNTYTQQISKDIEWSKTSEIAEYFYYAGPRDEKNREYCAEHVGKAYTKEEAVAIQAEIMSFYNCRHRLEPISEETYLAYKAAE